MAESDKTNETADEPQAVVGMLAEFDGPEALVAAARRVREAGYRNWDAHSPFPVHGLDGAMGIRRTVLPLLVFGAGVAGAIVAIHLQWWTNAVDYPFLVSGKPLFSLPANVPIAFELIVLFSALVAFVGVLALNRLPQFAHPLFRNERFRRATTDGFFISVEAVDSKFDESETKALFESIGATAVETCCQTADGRSIPKGIYWTLAVVTAFALLPPLFIAWHRAVPKREPRLHVVFDMDSQPKYKTQTASPLFADGRAMRLPVEGTVARGELSDDDALYRGRVPGQEEQWVDTIPLEVTESLMRRGRQRYGVFCATCHGLAGDADGMTAIRAVKWAEEQALKGVEKNWAPPTSLHTEAVREQPVGQLFHAITNGVRTMPAYGSQIPVEDRWAIVLYVRALERSRNASLDDVPPDKRDQIR
ncbi:MAG: quinol:electron acceptor oxidoreductase subunit ActD [Planctomycetota bacterium]|jgi:mono/diheme cytochrome c family protein